MLDRIFKLKQNNTTIRTEAVAGITTFMTMAYIIFVQPAVLSMAGMDFNAVMVATCIASAVACFVMAFLANYPIALAPAMGHNVYFAFVACPLIAKSLGENASVASWQVALGAVFISGVLFLIFSIIGLRETIIKAVPASLRNSIAVGIGLLIAMVGFQWSGLTVADPVIYVRLGDLHNPAVLLSIFGLAVISVLLVLKIRGAILIGIIATAILGMPLGIVEYSGAISKVPSLEPTFMRLSFSHAVGMGFLEIIFGGQLCLHK
jgi:AGZA family xanthine/uracil permease-like MFS transporter